MYGIIWIFSICILSFNVVCADILPTIFWHPRNPIFSCDVVRLNVRYQDQINFYCPTSEINPVASTSVAAQLYESLYVVETVQQYQACNSTGAMQFLRCDPRRANEPCDNGGLNCPLFYNMIFREAASPNDIRFVKGGDYYFIATSFRTANRLDNRLGGSCNRKQNEDEYFMRLQIHVCTDEEVAEKKCERCLTEACFYKGCKTQTGNWETKNGLIHQDKNNKCFVPEQRNILDELIGSTTSEFRTTEITCPADDCTQWISDEQERYFKNNRCFREQTRSCTSRINGVVRPERRYSELRCPDKICSDWKNENEKSYKYQDRCFVPQTRTCLHPWVQVSALEYNDLEVTCSNTTTFPITGGVKSADETDDKETIYIVVAVFSSLLCFIIGALLGSCIIKKIYKQKKQLNYNSQIATIPATILDGETYLNSKPEGVDLVNDAPFYLVDGMVLGANNPSPIDNNVQQFNKIPVTRSVSFQHIDNRTILPQPTSTLPRNPGRSKVTRVPSTTSQILLLRHVSDAASFNGSRLNSESLDKMVSQNKRRLNSTTEENVYDV